MRDIEACRTAQLGGHLDLCLDCGHQRPAYNSCRNRHCPKCQSLDQERWLDGRLETILPVPYFHVVFTLPGELAPLTLHNRRLVFALLFRAASETLLTLGRDPKRLGGQLGITIVLHTWTRNLRFHPHVHCIVTGGGLSADGERWLEARQSYLFPVKVLSRLFRGKILDALTRAHEQALLDLPDELVGEHAFAKLRSRLYDKEWVTYAKPPFAGPEQVFAYLGRYTHRVGLSNRRILDVQPDSVTLRTRGDDSVTLQPQELIRRFLLHILPRGFVKIRHFGLVASSNVKTRLETARRLLAEQAPRIEPPRDAESCNDWRTLLEQLTGVDPTVCPACGSHRWARVSLETAQSPRPPPDPPR
jgi:hypothetical protein